MLAAAVACATAVLISLSGPTVHRLSCEYGLDLPVLGCNDKRLLAAVTIGDLSELQKVLAEGYLRRHNAPTGISPVHVACSLGDVNSFVLLAQHAALLPAADGSTCLHLAIEAGEPVGMELVKVLIQARINLNARTIDGRTPLWNAITLGDRNEMVKWLLHFGADPDIGIDEQHAMAAGSRGQVARHADSVAGSAAAGSPALLNPTTPLQYCASTGNAECVGLLLQAKAKRDLGNRFGSTALMMAAHNDDASMVATLARAGANVEARTAGGFRCLSLAVFAGAETACKTLLSSNADVMHTMDDGRNVLHLAAQAGKPSLLTLLLSSIPAPQAKQLLEQREKHGATPLLTACGMKSMSLIPLLLEAGADAGVATGKGVTCFMMLAAGGREYDTAATKLVPALVAAGADAGAETSTRSHGHYTSAKYIADESGAKELAAALVKEILAAAERAFAEVNREFT